ncbi:MAG TPA: hypothetical protein VMV78_12305 [Thiobacillus sp.]|nr:hypothetical protein [Thiobacillus sp.]
MALPTITLVNLTGGAITLEQLAVTVPASGSLDVTNFDRPGEVLNDAELQASLDAGDLRINITGGALSAAATTKTLAQSQAIVQPIHDLDIQHNLAGTVAPGVSDDEDAGYAVGSVWVDTTGSTYYVCISAAAGAAVWSANGGGAAGWDAVLAVGQTSGGTDPILSTGDTFRGPDGASSFGGTPFNIRGANSTAGNGQPIIITGGISNSAGGDAGGVSVLGGQPTGTGNAQGGPILIAGGDGGTAGNTLGGGVTITTGSGFNSAGPAGDFTVTCGTAAPTGTGSTGNITLTGGPNPATGLSNIGGLVTIDAGTSFGRTGSAFLRSGNSLATSNSNNQIGNVTIATGLMSGTATTWNGGSISITANGDTSGGSNNVEGGDVSIAAGNTGTRNANGGDVNVTAGHANGFSVLQAGNVNITAGNLLSTNPSAGSEGGSIVLSPGVRSVSDQHDGMVRIDSTGTLQMLERAAVVTGITGGEGRWWVRNDSPNLPMFTDGLGNDHVLNESTPSTLQEAYEAGNTIVTDATNGPLDVSGTEAISLDAGAASNFSTSAGTMTVTAAGGATTVSGLAVNITALAAALADDITLTGATPSGAGNPGGDIILASGDGNTAGAGGTITGTAGDGGTTGTGGVVSFTGGGGGSTSGNGGGVTLSGGIPVDGNGGGVNLVGEDGVGTDRSGGTVNIDAGDSTGTANGAPINVTAGAGSVSSVGGAVNIDGGEGRTGGAVNITSGAPLGALEAGDVNITAAKAGGAPGKIVLQTESDDAITAPVEISTQSGFADQGEKKRTFGRSELIAISTSNQAVVDLATIVSNGDQQRIQVKLTAVDSTTDTNVLSYRYDGDFYRSGGTITAMTPHTDTNTLVGAGVFTANVSFNIGISGSTIRLEISNTYNVTAFTVNISATFITQLGGAAS